jgi:cell wall-associated NlpC family hydrolase
MSTTTSRTSARALTLGAALLIGSTLFAVPAPQARAAAAPVTTAGVTTSDSRSVTTKPVKPSFAERVLSVVSSRRGSPYSYGASGPRRFDCSGLTMWTFRKLGRRLPHSSSAQYGRTKHIRASARRPGDLVFFHDGGGIYHVAIYAGHNKIWHAPYSGTRVRKERLWTSAVYYGRMRGSA